jgi:hypothetical protein
MRGLPARMQLILWRVPKQEQEEWRPLALMVAQFEAATPARFSRAGPRAVQYVPPPPPDPNGRPQVWALFRPPWPLPNVSKGKRQTRAWCWTPRSPAGMARLCCQSSCSGGSSSSSMARFETACSTKHHAEPTSSITAVWCRKAAKHSK